MNYVEEKEHKFKGRISRFGVVEELDCESRILKGMKIMVKKEVLLNSKNCQK